MDWSVTTNVVLGAVLAILTTFITQLYNEWRMDRLKRSQLQRFLTSELSNCIPRIDSLLSFYYESKTPNPNFLVALERAAGLFTKYREAAYLLDTRTSQQVLEFYDGLDRGIEIIQSMLRLLENPNHQAFVIREIEKQMDELKRMSALGKQILHTFDTHFLNKSPK